MINRGRTDTQKFGGYNIIPRHFLWRGIKINNFVLYIDIAPWFGTILCKGDKSICFPGRYMYFLQESHLSFFLKERIYSLMGILTNI